MAAVAPNPDDHVSLTTHPPYREIDRKRHGRTARDWGGVLDGSELDRTAGGRAHEPAATGE
jgi:hypothetical protein